MDSDYCRVKIKKRFLKCISVKDGKCYLMVGRNQKIRGIMNTIETNVKKKRNLLQEVSNESIKILYSYLSDGDLTKVSDMKSYILSYLDIERYLDNIRFVKQDICNDDDTLKDVLNKLAIYACPGEKIVHKHIYAWYKTEKGINQSLGFNYGDMIELDDHNLSNNRKPEIDTQFVNELGKKVMVPMENTLLKLFETCDDIYNDTIYFCSLKQFLKSKDYEGDDLFSVLQEDSIEKSTKLRVVHSIISKYWPYLDTNEILNYDLLEGSRKQLYELIKVRYSESFKYMNIMESQYFMNELNLVPCSENTIEMMQLVKQGNGKNIVNLTNLFRDVRLTEKIPFMKLILESRDDVLFKVNNEHMIYEGKDRTSTRFISKDVCKLWSDDLVLQTNFGYRYLHKENAILMKIYDKETNTYTTLIIHLNGDIECVFSELGPQTTESVIIRLIRLCNEVLQDLNQQTMFSFDPLPLLDEDIYENIYSDTQLTFKNCRLTFSKGEFEDKQKKILPNVLEMMKTFLTNYPLYFRVKLIGEVDDDSQKIICSYKRVNNYAVIETIHSFISTITNIDPTIEQEEIIDEIRHQFSLEHDEAYLKYVSWKETTQVKLQNMMPQRRDKLVVKESGAEVILSYEENLTITMKQITSFSEYKRILMFLKTMVYLYQKKIQGNMTQKQLHQLFNETFVEISDSDSGSDDSGSDSDDDSSSDDEETITEDEGEDDDEEDDELSDLSDLEELTDDDEDEDDEIDYDQLGGSQKVYETKSYYLKRLKKRDKGLFVYKNKPTKKDEKEKRGYSSYCQATDKRVPIVVSREELERINQSYDEGSGRESYSNAITVDGRSPDIFYICPKYWDMEKELSIRPDYIESLSAEDKERILVPENKLTKGETTKYVLQRIGDNWRGATEVKFYKTMITEESRLLHPEGYGLPCCFNMSKSIKKGEDVTVNTKTQTNYISKADPVEENKYAHIHPQLKEIFKQENETLTKKTSKGFLRKGVLQNKALHNYQISSFLESYRLLSGFKGTNEEFIDSIQKALETNLRLFQRCPFFIHSQFRKSDNHNYEYITKVLEKKETRKLFQKDCIDKLLIQIRRKEFNFYKNEMAYLFNLISTLENYCNYLKSDENRNHEYILPVLSVINDKLNIILFENNEDNITIKETDYNSSKQYAFIYKRKQYYEPILYRYHEKSRMKELKNFNVMTLQNNHLEKIVKKIQTYVDSKREESPLNQYISIIEEDDKVESYYLNHYSQVSYIYTEKQNIIPLPPCQVPNDEIPFIYDFVSYSDIQVNDKVKFVYKKETVFAKVVSIPGKHKVEVEDKEKKTYTLLFTRLCFLKNNGVCYAKRPKFSKAFEYLQKFQSIVKIKGIHVDEDNYVVTIILDNETIIPIQYELYDKQNSKINTLPILGNYDMLLLENKLRNHESKETDLCHQFKNYQRYEDFIMKLAHHHLIYLLTHYTYDILCMFTNEKEYKIKDKVRFEYVKNLRGDETIFEISETIQGGLMGVIKKVRGVNYVVSVSLLDYLETIIDDPIQLVQDKKKEIHNVFRKYISKVFYVMDDSEFEFTKNRQTRLCLGSQSSEYPCYKQGDKSQLIVKETDYEGNQLLIKIISRFVDLLMIHGINRLYSIVQETTSIQYLKHMKVKNEDIYSYHELRGNYLDQLFKWKNPFVQDYQSSHSDIRKVNIRLLNENPYIIRKLYGQGVTITFMNEIENKDFQLLALSLSEVVSETINEYMLKELLIQQINQSEKVVELFKNGKQKQYANIKEIIDDIQTDTYVIDEIDIRFIIEKLKGQGKDIGCLLFSQKYNPKKAYKHYLIGDIKEETPILSMCHSFNTDKQRYDLSTILKNNIYSFTKRKLVSFHSSFQRFLS